MLAAIKAEPSARMRGVEQRRCVLDEDGGTKAAMGTFELLLALDMRARRDGSVEEGKKEVLCGARDEMMVHGRCCCC